VLVGEGRGSFREVSSETKRVDDFAAMSDEELRAYVYGNKGETKE
jgi:hypothetical protein